MRYGPQIAAAELDRVCIAVDDGGCDGAVLHLIDETKYHDGKDGADGAERHEAEAVGLGVFVASYGSHADAQRHDEGYGHRSCRDTAGVKGDAEEVGIRKNCKGKDDYVASKQHPAQLHCK